MLRLARDDEGAPEIFRSVQGEGPMAGRERTFVRLSGCNLHCVWCDTAYTWNWQGLPFAHESGRQYDPKHEMVKLSVAETAERIRALPSEGLVISGGEPMMQSEALSALIDALAPLRIEMETNGTIAPSAALAAKVDLFVVSPKLAHSGNAAALALKPDTLTAFAALPQAHFKFVAREAADIDTVAQLAAAHAIPAARISIMPEGTTSEALRARAALLTPAATQHGFAMSDRLHIHRFGQKRGI